MRKPAVPAAPHGSFATMSYDEEPAASATSPPRLIGLDWGSSQLRVWLYGPDGAVLAERNSSDGASRLTGGPAAFDAALGAVAGDWLGLGLPMLACGMVGSAHGWLEAAYVACPTALDRLHEHLAALTTSAGARLHIVPGLIDHPRPGTPDVMRGEETQLIGLLAGDPTLAFACTVVMPGTHSKWVSVREGRVSGFRTRMTGELYALLRQHSVLARLMPDGQSDWHSDGFDAGLNSARQSGGTDLSGQLFAARSLGLTSQLASAALPDYLSGLLIGHELLAGLSNHVGRLVLVGDAALCQRYRHALMRWGTAVQGEHSQTASAGLWRLAAQAGLTDS